MHVILILVIIMALLTCVQTLICTVFFSKDIGDLQNFVTTALTTAAGGEGDFTRDRLSNLRTVGKGFAALIYKLPQDMGYKQLEGRCKLLWEALDQDPRLPALLVN